MGVPTALLLIFGSGLPLEEMFFSADAENGFCNLKLRALSIHKK